MPGPQATKSFPVDLKWEDPDESKRVEDLYLYRDVLKKIQANPGKWARVRVMTQSSAYSTRKRLKKILLAGDPHWELVVARVPNSGDKDLRGVYIRYRTDEQMQEGA